MSSEILKKGYVCSTCGKYHDDVPMNFGFNAPFYWNDKFSKINSEKNIISSDLCIIDGTNFFIKGVVEIPVTDGDKTFNWGVWVSLSEKNFKRYAEVYDTDSETKEKSYFGWFSNQLPGYPDTLKIKTQVHLQGNKRRPKIFLDHSDPHQLCQEQHNGITMHRVLEIIEKASVLS